MDSSVLEKVDISSIMSDSWKVVLHNDDKTSMEFVISILMNIFQKSYEQSYTIMMKVHTQGKAVVSEYSSFEIAEEKVAEVHRIAAFYGFPLKASVEK